MIINVKTIGLFFLSASVCYAQMTTIIAPMRNPVQCNNWGWVLDNAQTAWNNVCKPLEVHASNGQIYSVENTDMCDENESAVFLYQDNNTEIPFVGCYPIKH